MTEAFKSLQTSDKLVCNHILRKLLKNVFGKKKNVTNVHVTTNFVKVKRIVHKTICKIWKAYVLMNLMKQQVKYIPHRIIFHLFAEVYAILELIACPLNMGIITCLSIKKLVSEVNEISFPWVLLEITLSCCQLFLYFIDIIKTDVN